MSLFNKEYSKEQFVLQCYLSRMRGFISILKECPSALPKIWKRYMDVKSKISDFKKENTNNSKKVLKLINDCDSIINDLDRRIEKIMGKIENKMTSNLENMERKSNQYMKQNGLNINDLSSVEDDQEIEETLNGIMMRDAILRGDNETYEIYRDKQNNLRR